MSRTTQTRSEKAQRLREEGLDRYRSWPDLTFYYHLGWQELADMPHWLRRVYIDELPRLLAQKQSSDIDVSMFPHMKQNAQRRVLRRIQRDTRQEPKRFKDLEDQKESLQQSQIPIAVKTVPMKPKGGEA